MEELQSLMACLDDISSKIGDGMYLDMADKMKRIHDKLNGNKPFHEDSFYYSSDNEDSNSDDDSGYDSDYNERARRQVTIQLIRDHLLDYVRSMHQTWAQLQEWEKEVKKVIPLIKRMSAVRKAEAIHILVHSLSLWRIVSDWFNWFIVVSRGPLRMKLF